MWYIVTQKPLSIPYKYLYQARSRAKHYIDLYLCISICIMYYVYTDVENILFILKGIEHIKHKGIMYIYTCRLAEEEINGRYETCFNL